MFTYTSQLYYMPMAEAPQHLGTSCSLFAGVHWTQVKPVVLFNTIPLQKKASINMLVFTSPLYADTHYAQVKEAKPNRAISVVETDCQVSQGSRQEQCQLVLWYSHSCAC
jgi:hypothetical protein